MKKSKPIVYICQCPNCQQEDDHPDKKMHHQMNLLISRLDEQQKRLYVALESKRIGHGGDKLLSQITGMDEKTIRTGRKNLDKDLNDLPVDSIRKKGAGRPLIEKKESNN